MPIVDVHSHFFAATFFKTLAAQSPLPGDPAARLAAVAKRTGIEVPPDDVRAHVARWIGALDRHDVEHLATFASVPEEIPDVAQAITLGDGRISGFAIANPRVDGAAGRVRKLLDEQGFRGLLLFPAMHHYDVAGKESRDVLAVLDERAATVFVHCGMLVVKLRDLLGLPRPVDLAFANPLAIVPAANAFPRVRFVIPHFGAGLFRETLIAGAQCPNVLVDTSSSNSWIATQPSKLTLAEVFERALGVFGPARIVFGTDSNTFPAGWRHDRYEEQHAALTSLGAPSADIERIFAGNARLLLGLAQR